MNLLRLFRQSDRPSRRITARRPSVEGLEGRQLLSSIRGVHADGIIGRHIGVDVQVDAQKVREAVQGAHIGSAMVQGAHIGVTPDIIAIL